MGTKTPITSFDLRDIVCGTCSQGRVTTQAYIYCSSCKNGFCFDCFKIHRVKAGTRDHDVIHLNDANFSQIKKLVESHNERPIKSDRMGQWNKRLSPSNNLESKARYIEALAANHDHEKNDMENELFCPQHEVVFCEVCTIDHKYCQNVVPIVVIAKQVKEQGGNSKIESALQKYNKFTSILIDDRINERSRMESSRSELLLQVKKARHDILGVLDELEEKVSRKLNVQTQNNSDKINQQINMCSKIKAFAKSALHDLQTSTNSSTKDSRFVKTYFKLHRKYTLYEKYLKEVYEDCKSYTYVFHQDDAYHHLLRYLTTLGSIQEISSPSKLPPFLRENPPHFLHELDFKNNKVVRLWGINGQGGINAVQCLDNGYVATLNRNLCELRIFTEKGWTLVTYKLQGSPWEFTFTSETEVAITVPGYHKIVVLDMQTDFRTISFVREITTEDECWGISTLEDKLIITANPWTPDASIQMLSFDGRMLKKIKYDYNNKVIFKAPQHIASDRHNKVFHVSDSAYHRVVTLSIIGEVLSIFNDANLGMPTGLALDYQGNLYVCAKETNCVFQVPSANIQHRQIISESSGISKLLAISFNPENDSVILACSGKAELRVFKGTK